MSDLHIQASFNSGEWSPKLYSRVDLSKYRSGAALLQNWFVDYRGGASTRPGTKYVLQCFKSNTAVRLLPFQASFTVGYVLEFGDHYVRFFFNGAPVLETSLAITGATRANPCILTIPGNTYAIGDWIFVTGVVGMTQLNGRYFKVTNAAGSAVTIANLQGVPVDSTLYNVYASGGTASRVYTITSPYAAADLAKLKYAQNVNQMVLTHPSYQPYVLTLVTATNWTLLPIVIGTTAGAPTVAGVAATFPSPGSAPSSTYYAYVVTTIDANGQESSPSSTFNIGPTYDLRTVAGSNFLSWNAVAGAVGYNVYKCDVSYFGAPSANLIFGFIGSTTAPLSTFVDSNIAPDFTQTPPIAKNPFLGAGVASVTVTSPGTYTSVPTASLTGASSTIAGSLSVTLQVQGTPTVGAGGTNYHVGDTVTFTNGVILVVATVAAGAVATWQPITTAPSNPGSVSSGSTPANPVAQQSTSGTGTGATANLTWGVGQVQVLNSGAGYTSTPTVTFSSGVATATAILSTNSNGFPSVCAFFQQRLILAGPTASPQTLYMSQPGAFYNFNVSSPAQATDSITATLVSGQLNTIKSMVSQTTGLLVLTDRASWLINGGSPGSAITPSALVANAQSFNGVSDVPPIIANYDVLYVQAKGSIVRDSAYNIYANVYTGTDISILASHLFYGFNITGWAWAEEPFKMVWAVRSDGTMLTLTFLKEQEFIGWAHSVTAGTFQSVTTVTEQSTPAGTVDAVYTIVQRTVNGNVVQYIERIAERIFTNGVKDAWCVDAALQYVGVPATTFSGAEHLVGLTVTGLADGIIIPPFVMPTTGIFSLNTPASKVTVGIGYVCDLQTLAVDLGEPTIQGRVKKIQDVDARVTETLGLQVGSNPTDLVIMDDLVRGNISSMLTGQRNQIVTDLVTGDAKTIIDPTYTIPGQVSFRQSNPYPATVLGVILNVVEHVREKHQ
jgi:hypothetical protein